MKECTMCRRVPEASTADLLSHLRQWLGGLCLPCRRIITAEWDRWADARYGAPPLDLRLGVLDWGSAEGFARASRITRHALAQGRARLTRGDVPT